MTPAEPRQRNLSPWWQRMARLAEVEHRDPPPVEDPRGFEAWRVRCRASLVEMIGTPPDRVEPDLEVTESVECGTYRRDKVVFDTEATMSVPAYLLVPYDRAAPGPAVLAQHGHGAGKAEVCGLTASSAPGGDYARQLAERGYVVLAPDLRCFGERADWNPPDHYGCDTNLVHALMEGRSPLAENLWDLARCLDVLGDHPLVDPARIGMAGLSYGATVTLFLAAWDPRVAASVVSGFFSSWAESHRVPWNMCGSQVLPGMLGRVEQVDLAALVAPRPLLVESGSEDFAFPVATAREEIAKLRVLYERLGAGERLVHDVFDGGHQWHGERVWDFLERWL